MKVPSSRAIAISVGLAVSLYLGLTIWAGWRDVCAAALKAGIGVISLLLAMSLLSYGLRFVRWHAYLRLLGCSVNWRDDMHIYFAGFALTTTPGKAGEMARSIWLREHGVPVRVSVAAFFAERVQDMLAILLLCCIGLTIYPAGRPLVIGCLVVMSIIAVVLAHPRWPDRLHVLTRGRAGRLGRLAGGATAMMLEFRRCFAPLPFAGGLLIGLAGWGAEAFAFGALLSALGVDLAPVTSVFIYSFAMLAGAASFLPGGLGGAEAAMMAVLDLVGVPSATAVAATVLLRLTTLWFAVGLGVAAIATLRTLPHQVRQAG
jgi:uncharacterized membrane protein YbhN (UPF0104 family)